MSGSEDDRDDFGAPEDRLMHGKTAGFVSMKFAKVHIASMIHEQGGFA